MDNPKVSVITVVYNSKDLFTRTLESIKNLKYSNKEVIVIDGGSTDGTKEVIERNSLYINTWISERDKGIYDAMNKALRLATGEYVWFINAGDYPFSPHILENIFKGREVYADIYYGETLIINDEGYILGLRKKKLPKKLTANAFLDGMVVCHQSFIAKKKILRPFDTRYKHSADYDQMIKAVKLAKSTYKVNGAVSVFAEGGHTEKNRMAGLKERYRIMKHYFGTFRTIFAHITIALKSPFRHYRKYKGPPPVIPKQPHNR